MIGESVGLAGLVRLHEHALDVACVGQLAQVGVAAGPDNGARERLRVAGIPQAQMQARRRLGILVLASVAVSGAQRAHGDAVDGPAQRRRRPVDGVSVKALRHVAAVGRGREGCSVVAARNALAEVIGLHGRPVLAEVAASPLPVDLVLIVGEEHRTCDDAHSRRGPHHQLDMAVPQVGIRPHRRRVAALGECELEAISPKGYMSVVGRNPLRRQLGSFREVDAVVLGKAWGLWAESWRPHRQLPKLRHGCFLNTLTLSWVTSCGGR